MQHQHVANQGTGRRTALVTGATGFIGSHLCAALVAAGWSVHAIVRPASDRSRIEPAPVVAHVHEGNTAQLTEIVRRVRPDVVFHLGALVQSSHTPDEVELMVASNVLFSTQLLEAMMCLPARRLVNTGTFAQNYGGLDYSPLNLYGATKQAVEAIARYYTEAEGYRGITLKLFNPYGPNDPGRRLLTQLHEAAQQPDKRLPMSPGEQLMDLVHVDDVSAAFLVAGERMLSGNVAADGESFTVSTGSPLTLREIVALYERVTGKNLPIDWGARPYRRREIMASWPNGQRLPGWRPTISLERGIAMLEQAAENPRGSVRRPPA